MRRRDAGQRRVSQIEFCSKEGEVCEKQTTRAGRVNLRKSLQARQARLMYFQYPNLPGGGGLRIVYHIRGSNNATQLAA